MDENEIENGEELVKIKQKERKQRKKKKKSNLIRRILRFFTTLLMVSGVGYILTLQGWYLPETAFSKLDGKTVQVVNNKIVKTSKIQETIKNINVIHLPLYMVKHTKLKNEINSLNPIESVYIRRYAFPARILIIIKEKLPIISIKTDIQNEPVAAYTKDGVLLIGKDYIPLPKEYNTILVLAQEQNYKHWDMNKIQEIEKISKYVETFSREQVEYIDIRNTNDIYVKIKSITIRLGKPDNKIYDRIKRIPSILPEVKKVKGKVKYIDLSWEDVNYLKLE